MSGGNRHVQILARTTVARKHERHGEWRTAGVILERIMETTDFPDSTDIEGVATNGAITFRMTAAKGVVRLLSVSSALSVVFHFRF